MIVAYLGILVGSPYRVMFFDNGPNDIMLHHVGPCLAFQTGLNSNVFLSTVEFSAFSLLSVMPRVADAFLYELCPSGYLCIDCSELRPTEDWSFVQPFERAVSRPPSEFSSEEVCIWFVGACKSDNVAMMAQLQF